VRLGEETDTRPCEERAEELRDADVEGIRAEMQHPRTRADLADAVEGEQAGDPAAVLVHLGVPVDPEVKTTQTAPVEGTAGRQRRLEDVFHSPSVGSSGSVSTSRPRESPRAVVSGAQRTTVACTF
jgi:hypothetical protein